MKIENYDLSIDIRDTDPVSVSVYGNGHKISSSVRINGDTDNPNNAKGTIVNSFLGMGKDMNYINDFTQVTKALTTNDFEVEYEFKVGDETIKIPKFTGKFTDTDKNLDLKTKIVFNKIQ